MTIKKISGQKAKGLQGKTDWKKVKTMSESEIKISAMMDPDAHELNPGELAKLRREKKQF